MTSAGTKDEGRLTLESVYRSGEDLSMEKMATEEMEQREQQEPESSVVSYSQQRPKLFADTNITPETPISPTYKRQFYVMGAQPDTPLGEQKRVPQKNTRRSYTPSESTPNLFGSMPLQKSPFADWPKAEAGEGHSSNQPSLEPLELPIKEANTPNVLPNQYSVRSNINKATSNVARVCVIPKALSPC